MDDKEILDISNGAKPDYPILIVICAKQMTDKRTMGKVLETMLDRAHGKAKQQMEHSGEINLLKHSYTLPDGTKVEI